MGKRARLWDGGSRRAALAVADARSFERLCRAHTELRREFDTLVRYLDTYVAKGSLHRDRFGETLKQHPLYAGGPPQPLPNGLDALDHLSPGLFQILSESGAARADLAALLQASSNQKARVDAVRVARIFVFGGSESIRGDVLKTAESLDICRGVWTALPPAQMSRAGFVAACLADHVYVVGGLAKSAIEAFSCSQLGRRVDRFNLKTQQWQDGPPPAQMREARFAAAAVTLDGRLYVVGGVRNDLVHRTLECFDPLGADGRGEWALQSAKMLDARRALAATALPGQEPALLVCGGRDEGTLHTTAEVLSLSGGGGPWRRIAPLAGPRAGHAAATLGGRVFVSGGFRGDGTLLGSIEQFDPESGSWSEHSTMSIGRAMHSMVATSGRLYVLGGTRSSVEGGLRSVERCEPTEGAWKPSEDMLQGRRGHCAVVAQVGALVALGPAVQR